MLDRRVHRQIERKTGLAHRSPGGEDDQVGSLKTAQELVEIHVTSRDAVAGGFAVLERFDLLHVFGEHVLEGAEVAGHPFFGDAVDQLLGFFERDFRGQVVTVGDLGDRLRLGDQLAHDRGALDDSSVMLDVGGAGRGEIQLAQIQQTTRSLVGALLLQAVGGAVIVDWLAVAKERQHGPKHMAVALLIKVLGLEKVRDADDAGRILQDGAEHRFFGLDAVRRQAEVALFRVGRSAQGCEIVFQALDGHEASSSLAIRRRGRAPRR